MIQIVPLVAVVMLAMVGDTRAQNCESLSGPARTDCFIARAHIFGQQSEIAAGKARKRADDESLRAATGTGSASPPHRPKPKHKATSPLN
jgi:hypothetical protein